MSAVEVTVRFVEHRHVQRESRRAVVAIVSAMTGVDIEFLAAEVGRICTKRQTEHTKCQYTDFLHSLFLLNCHNVNLSVDAVISNLATIGRNTREHVDFAFNAFEFLIVCAVDSNNNDVA